ncbi:unnamed protein product [Amaranthus hypochondriacus]
MSSTSSARHLLNCKNSVGVSEQNTLKAAGKVAPPVKNGASSLFFSMLPKGSNSPPSAPSTGINKIND